MSKLPYVYGAMWRPKSIPAPVENGPAERLPRPDRMVGEARLFNLMITPAMAALVVLILAMAINIYSTSC